MRPITIDLPPELLQDLAARVAELLPASEPPAAPSPYMSTDQAATFLSCSRQRIHDLLSQGKLSRLKEGRRTLLRRSEVEALVQVERERRRSR